MGQFLRRELIYPFRCSNSSDKQTKKKSHTKTILSGWRKRTLSPRMVYSFPSSFPSVFPFPSSLRRPNGWEQFAFMPISKFGRPVLHASARSHSRDDSDYGDQSIQLSVRHSGSATPGSVCVCVANGRTINLHVDA